MDEREIQVPFEIDFPKRARTDALCDLDIRIRQALDFCGGALYLLGRPSPDQFTPGEARVELKDLRSRVESVVKVRLTKESIPNMPRTFPGRVFTSGVIQLAAAFEAFLGDLLADVYFNNDRLLVSHEQKLEAKAVLESGSIEKVRRGLIESVIEKYVAASYPRMADLFEQYLHIGLHSKRSPISRSEAHHFFEVRNIVVHNEGRASQQYLERMAEYAETPARNQLTERKQRFPVDFGWLFDQGRLVFELGNFIDQEVTSKWTTTASPDGEPAMFWYGSSA